MQDRICIPRHFSALLHKMHISFLGCQYWCRSGIFRMNTHCRSHPSGSSKSVSLQPLFLPNDPLRLTGIYTLSVDEVLIKTGWIWYPPPPNYSLCEHTEHVHAQKLSYATDLRIHRHWTALSSQRPIQAAVSSRHTGSSFSDKWFFSNNGTKSLGNSRLWDAIPAPGFCPHYFTAALSILHFGCMWL